MQSVSSRIWTRITVSISYDDNHYTTGTSNNIVNMLLRRPFIYQNEGTYDSDVKDYASSSWPIIGQNSVENKLLAMLQFQLLMNFVHTKSKVR